MNIDYYKMKKESERMGISPYLHIKRKINYRKARPNEYGCKFCNHLKYSDDKHPTECFRKKHCDIIGVGIYPHAEVEFNFICDLVDIE